MGTLLGEPLGGTLLGTSSWLLGTVAWEPVPGNLLETLLGNRFLGTLLRNLAWEPLPGNLVPNLAPCRSGCSEGFSCKRKLFLGTFLGTRFPADLAAPTCSGTFTMADDPKLTLLGNLKNKRFDSLGIYMCVCHCHCHLHISTPQQNDICNSQLLSLFGTTPVRL